MLNLYDYSAVCNFIINQSYILELTYAIIKINK